MHYIISLALSQSEPIRFTWFLSLLIHKCAKISNNLNKTWQSTFLCNYFTKILFIHSSFLLADQYVYDSGSLHPSDSHISLKLLDEHKIHKRDTQVKNQDAILDNRSNPEPPTTTTETVIIQNKVSGRVRLKFI